MSGNDDARGQDSYLRWPVPEDGDYYIRITDHLGQGGRHVRVSRGDDARHAVAQDRHSASRSLFANAADDRRAARQSLRNADHGDARRFRRADRAAAAELDSRRDDDGAADAPQHESDAGRLRGGRRCADRRRSRRPAGEAGRSEASAAVEGGFENIADFVLGEPNNAVFISGIAHKLAMAVGEKVPFHLEIVQPKVPLVRSGTMNLKVVVHRDAGFDAPLTCYFRSTRRALARPARSRSTKGKNEGLYPLNANGDAMIGKWPMMVIGAAEIDGQAWVSSQLAELEIADRYVGFDMKRAACDKGQAAQIQCTLTHNTPFEGNAKAELLGLPPGATADPVEFTKDTKELAFQVKTTKDTPVGSHKSLFCQVTITQNGEPIVGTVGTTELQVNEPPAAAPAPPPQQPKRPKPAAARQPRSRFRGWSSFAPRSFRAERRSHERNAC